MAPQTDYLVLPGDIDDVDKQSVKDEQEEAYQDHLVALVRAHPCPFGIDGEKYNVYVMSFAFFWLFAAFFATQNFVTSILPDGEGNTCLSMLSVTYAVSVAVDCQFGVIDALDALSGEVIPTKQGTTLPQDEVDRLTEIVAGMSDVAWGPLLATLSLLIAAPAPPQNLLQAAVRGYQSCTKAFGMMSLVTPRDAFLTSLCKYAVPISEAGESMAASASTSASDGRVLSEKNVMAIRTLFNITHCLGAYLDTAWQFVLQTLEHVDYIINDPQHDAAFQAIHPSSDMNILVEMLNGLFESSKTLGEDALTHMMTGLCTLSLSALANADIAYTSGKDQNMTIFGLQKMVELTSYNSFRISAIWDLAITHLIVVANHKNPMIRDQGLDAITLLVVSALNGDDGASNDVTQKKLLDPLNDLAASRNPDTQEKVNDSIFKILQQSGHSLKNGWLTVLEVLQAVAATDKVPGISAAFKSVELIGNDFLSTMPVYCHEECIKTVGCYASQKADINIGLTAVNMLWTYADVLKDLFPGNATEEETKNLRFQIQDNDSSTSPDPELWADGSAYPLLPETPDQLLWLAFYLEAKRLGVDPRPELRNCALQTLTSTLVTNGVYLDKSGWLNCLWRILLPLLASVESAAEAASDQEVNHEIGKEKGKAVMMLVHHSRDTASKQWDETKVLALNCVGRVWKTFFVQLCEASGFDAAWVGYLTYVTKSITNPNKDVAMSGIQNLQAVLMTHGGKPYFQRKWWDQVWLVYEESAQRLSENTSISYKVLKAFVQSIADIHEHVASVITPSDIRRLMVLLDKLTTCKSTNSDASPTVLYSSTMELLENFAPYDEPVWPSVFSQLTRFIERAMVPVNKAHPKDEVLLQTIALRIDRQSMQLCQKAMELIGTFFKDNAPVGTRALVFDEVVCAIGSLCLTKYTCPSVELWPQAVEQFVRLCCIGIHAVNDAGFVQERVGEIWSHIATTIQEYLLPTPESLELHPKHESEVITPGTEEQLDVDLILLVVSDLLTNCDQVPSDIRWKLVSVLDEGVTQHGREVLSKACVQSLFELSMRGGSDNTTSLDVSKMAAPVLISHCGDVLERFATDDRQSGQRPLPKSRLDEVAFILNKLKRMELHADVLPAAPHMSDATSFPDGRTGRRGHLLHLFPQLCDCITSNQEEFKEILKDIFHLVSQELHLDQSVLSALKNLE
eukprot:GFYU01010299.1.p1 GENE.GFYU01010299.1~~GFYU01010299.1.p1  ORF type:complete len:1193 (-),score=343.40 GFYU01010299.1:31-3609(-)